LARLVIDASVAAKWVAPEPESDRAVVLLDPELWAPDLIFPEIANILWKKHSRAQMTAAAVRLASRWMRQVPLHIEVSADLMDNALALSLRLDHPAYNCFYLALRRLADAPLVTADHRLVERCRRADAADPAPQVLSLDAIAP
jgi:predicted nucleic acid-binding protein